MRKSPITDLLLPYSGGHIVHPQENLHTYAQTCTCPTHRNTELQKEKSKKDWRVTGPGLVYVQIIPCSLSRKAGSVN